MKTHWIVIITVIVTVIVLWLIGNSMLKGFALGNAANDPTKDGTKQMKSFTSDEIDAMLD